LHKKMRGESAHHKLKWHEPWVRERLPMYLNQIERRKCVQCSTSAICLFLRWHTQECGTQGDRAHQTEPTQRKAPRSHRRGGESHRLRACLEVRWSSQPPIAQGMRHVSTSKKLDVNWTFLGSTTFQRSNQKLGFPTVDLESSFHVEQTGLPNMVRTWDYAQPFRQPREASCGCWSAAAE